MQEHNNDVIYQDKLFFYDFIWQGNKIIYPALNCNAICETDITTGDTIVIGKTDEEKGSLFFDGIDKRKEYLILSSQDARIALSLFDLKTNEWSYIPTDENWKDRLNFRGEDVYEYNGYLYIFPYRLVVLKVDIKKRSIDYLFYPNIKPDRDIRGEIVCIENKIYIPLKHNNIIYKFDLNTEEWEVLEVNTELRGIDTLCFDGELFWMTGIGEMICSWHEKSNISVSYKDFPQQFKKIFDRENEEGYWFVCSAVYNGSIYFVPGDANMLIEFDIKNNKSNELFIEDEWEEEADTRIGRFSLVKYINAKMKDNILMMLSNKNKNLIIIDLDTKKINKVELNLCIKNGVDRLILGTSVIHEKLINLKMWLEYLAASEQWYSTTNESKEEITGRKIYFSC